MPEFSYKAMTKTGLIVRNRVEEQSKQNLIKKLKHNELTPISITQVGYARKATKKVNKRNIVDIDDIMKTANSASLNQGKRTLTLKEKVSIALMAEEKITNKDIKIFAQNFYLLKKANFNNIHALATIIQSTQNMSFRGILEDILAGVETGEYMYTTMEYYSNVFPYIFINMIKVGELSGSLTESLQKAEQYLEETEALNKKLKSILLPNIIQFVGIFIMLIVGTIVAIPAIQKVFDTIGSEEQLPGITIAFSNFVDWIIAHWYLPVFVIAGTIAILVAYVNTSKGKYNYHYFKYTMPIFGKLIYSLDLSKFLNAMLLNLQNGMRIQESLEVSKSVVKNYVMLSMIETSINNMLMGNSWIEPFEKSGLTNPMVTEMLKIGMQTDLTEMMEKLLDFMKIEIDNKIETIVKVLPEVTYAFVGAILIFFVIVVLVPCIQVYMGNFFFSAAGL